MTIENYHVQTPEPKPYFGGSLAGETLIVDEHGELVSLEDLACEYETPEVAVLSLDSHRRIKKTTASGFRLSTWAKEIYKITLENGHTITTTKNQLFMNASGEWIPAQDIVFRTVISTAIYNPSQPHPLTSLHEVTHVHREILDTKIPLYSFDIRKGTNLLCAQIIENTVSLVPVHSAN